MSVRVVLADDQPIVLAGLSLLLEVDPEIDVVATAENGERAVAAVAAHRPEVVVLDLRMPVMDGVEATRLITAGSGDPESGPVPAVLVLTTYDADAAVYGALGAGASGFLLKDAAPADLGRAVRSLARGEGWLSPSVTRRVIAQFSHRPLGVARHDPRLATLTAREIDVLVLIAHGLSNLEIADRLVVGEGTVKTHVSHLLAKLGLRDRAQAAVFAFTARLVDP